MTSKSSQDRSAGARAARRGAVARRIVLAPTLAALVMAAWPPAAAHAQVIRRDFYVTNGRVSAEVLQGNTLYIAGSFTQVGPATGGLVAIDSTSGNTVSGFPEVVGSVLAIAPDGAGGWYIGGSFSSVGGVARSSLARVLSDRSVSSWNPSVTGSVNAIGMNGNVVYIGGFFTSAGGQPRNHIAAIDATTGMATSWNPNAQNTVEALLVQGNKIYAGGFFTSIGGQSRNRIAALDSTTGLATAWNPNVSGVVNVAVYTLALKSAVLYIGGNFTSVGGQFRRNAAAVSPTTGLTNSWDPSANGIVFSLVPTAVEIYSIYAGGAFDSIGGAPRSRIANLNTSGSATAWNPNASATVQTITLGPNRVYAGGSFTNIGGQARANLAALASGSGLATSWNPSPNGTVYAVLPDSNLVLAGGTFTSLGGQTRNFIAALDATTGVPRPWNPNANAAVYALDVSGSTVYAGGNFTVIGGQSRNRIAALDTSGLVTPWNPNANNQVFRILVNGSTVYAGGAFFNIGGQARNGIAALSASTGLATSWNPNANTTVYDLELAGGLVYAGGAFTSIGGQMRNRIAALSPSTGLTTAWNPGANGTVFDLAIGDSLVYAGGDFTTFAGQMRNRLAAVDTVGVLSPWNPSANGRVLTLALDGSIMYVGGGFTVVGGLTRRRIAALDTGTGLATTWNPDAVDTVAVLVTNGSTVFAGGTFRSVGGQPQAFLAAIDGVCLPPDGIGSASATLGSPQISATGDFNGDGLLDLAIAINGGAQVLRNLGDGRFGSIAVVNPGGSGRGIAAADFNNDYALDLAISTSTGLYVALGGLTNGVPNGTFGAPVLYDAGGANPAGIAVADLNADGINDLVVAVTGIDRVAVLLGHGTRGIADGTFGPATLFNLVAAPMLPVLADFNGDGIWDVAVTGSNSQTIGVALGGATLGVGNGTFVGAMTYAVGGTPRPIAIGDFDRDGVTDLAVGTSGPNGVSILRGNGQGVGDGTFAPAVRYPAAGGFAGAVRDLKIADFDGNGRADVGAVLDDGTIQYLYGDGIAGRGNGQFVVGPVAMVGGALSTLEVNAFDAAAQAPTPIVAQSDLGQLVLLTGWCAGATQRSLDVVAPNGGEVLQLGTDIPIRWERNDLVIAVNVDLSRDDGAHWVRLASNQTGSQFLWTPTPPGTPHARIRVVDASMYTVSDPSNGAFSIQALVGVGPLTVDRPSLSLAYPNPTEASVRLDLTLPAAADVTVEVYDLMGRRVKTLAHGRLAAGAHALSWDGRGPTGGRVGTGMYFVRARMPGFEAVRRVVRIE